MRRRKQRGFIEAFIIGIPATVIILSVLALMSADAEGQEGACEPALFVEVGTAWNPPYVAWLWNEDGTLADDPIWLRARTPYVAVREIDRIHARYINGIGAGVQLTLDTRLAVLTEGGVQAPIPIAYFVDGETTHAFVQRIRCANRAASATARERPMTAEQRERAEARQFQILRALESLTIADLLMRDGEP